MSESAFPTADQVARALVAAAQETAELPRLRLATANPRTFPLSPMRCSYMALVSLEHCWPHIGRAHMAAVLGMGSLRETNRNLRAAKSQPGWSDAAVARVWTAI